MTDKNEDKFNEVQVRLETGELLYFNTIGEALIYSKSHPETIKISFSRQTPYGPERVRLVPIMNSEKKFYWVFDPCEFHLRKDGGEMIDNPQDYL